MAVIASVQNVLGVEEKARTQHEAVQEAKRLNEPKIRGRIARTKAYDCPWCDNWHVGHDNKLVPLWKQKE